MAIRVNTKSKGYNTDNEIKLFVNPNDGYGEAQINVDGSTDNIDLKIQAKGSGNVVISNIYVPGLSGTIEDKISAIESVLASVGVSGTNIDATSLATDVVTLGNELDDAEADIVSLQTQVDTLSGASAVYNGGTVTGEIIATADKNKIKSVFKVKTTSTWGPTTYEGLPLYSSFKGMSAFVEATGKYYYAGDEGWVPLQAENVYKTVYLSDDYIEHAHYASITPEQASDLLYGRVNYVDTKSSLSCSSQAHTHLVTWTKDGDGEIVARILAGNHEVTPHILSIENGYHLLVEALKDGVDENSVFQTCTLTTVEKVSGSFIEGQEVEHKHKATITVKQALELFKRQREFIETDDLIQTTSTTSYFNKQDVDFVDGEPKYGIHRHYVTWKYEAGQSGIIRQQHLGQYSNGEESSDELHNVDQYYHFGYIRPCTVSTNSPEEGDNVHIHEVSFTKSILNDIYTSLEATKFNKTGGIVHGRVGIRDGFTYIDAEPISGGGYEMVLGTNSTITTNTAPSGALDEKPYWQHEDNHALKIGNTYVSVMNDRDFGIGEFTHSQSPSADFHLYRPNTDATARVETENGWQPTVEICATTNDSTSGSDYGGRFLINNSRSPAYPLRNIGEVIIDSKSDEGISLAQGGNVGLRLTNTGDVEVRGNLVVFGDSIFAQESEVYFSDNIIELNSISGSANVTGLSLRVGFKFKRGPSLPDYELIWNEQSQLLEGGLAGSLQGFPTHNGIIEGGAVIMGSGGLSGAPGANTSTYENDYTALGFTHSGGLIVNPNSSSVAINLRNQNTLGSEKRIIGLADPIDEHDALNKQYFDAQVNNSFSLLEHHDINGLGDDDHTQYLTRDPRYGLNPGDTSRKFENIYEYDDDYNFTDDRQIPDKRYVDIAKQDLTDDLTDAFDTHTINDVDINGLSIHYRVDQIDHQVIPNSGTNTHAQIDSHIANTSNPHSVTTLQIGAMPLTGGTFTGPVIYDASAQATFNGVAEFTSVANFVNANASLTPTLDGHLTRKDYVDTTVSDAISALSIDQYILVNGTRAFTGAVEGIAPSLNSHLTTKTYVDTTVSDAISALTTNHGDLEPTSLLDDDHPQYSLADGTRSFTNVVEGVNPFLGSHLTTKTYVDAAVAGATGGGVNGAGTLWQQNATQIGVTDEWQFVGNTYIYGSQGLIVYADGVKLVKGSDYVEDVVGSTATVGDTIDNVTLINEFVGWVGELNAVNTGGGFAYHDDFSDDDHLQYPLIDGTRVFTGPIGGQTPVATNHLATKGYVDGFLNSTGDTATGDLVIDGTTLTINSDSRLRFLDGGSSEDYSIDLNGTTLAINSGPSTPILNISSTGISFNGNKTISNVADGVSTNDAINLGQLNQLETDLTSNNDLHTNFLNDDHTQYILANGSRDFSATVSYAGGVTPTLANHLTDKEYVDDEIAVVTSALENSSNTVRFAKSACNDPWHPEQGAWANGLAGFIDTDGNPWFVGINTNGNSGGGFTTSVDIDSYIKPYIFEKSDSATIVQIAMTFQDTLLLDSEGNVYHSGRNQSGLAGINGNTSTNRTFKRVAGLTSIQYIVMPNDTFQDTRPFAHFIDTSSNVYFLGLNNASKASGDSGISSGDHTTPKLVTTIGNQIGKTVKQLCSSSPASPCGVCLHTDGTLYSWGDNGHGALGQGNTTDLTTATLVNTAVITTGIADDVEIFFSRGASFGGSVMLVRSSVGKIYIAGGGTGPNTISGVFGGSARTSLWERDSGSADECFVNMVRESRFGIGARYGTTQVKLWGDNVYGQLGNGSIGDGTGSSNTITNAGGDIKKIYPMRGAWGIVEDTDNYIKISGAAEHNGNGNNANQGTFQRVAKNIDITKLGGNGHITSSSTFYLGTQGFDVLVVGTHVSTSTKSVGVGLEAGQSRHYAPLPIQFPTK